MNPYPYEVTCDVCGGPGVASSKVVAYQWIEKIQHSDPAICAERLEIKRKELDAREKKLQAKDIGS